ncbi:hypothetical protein CbuD7D7780_11670 (plasmid) [Coxiella burnetii]|uniref:Uncharacterized protein n=1 Tax=Coxiella burnetii (strain Dugway 5J108-111) TaxID=434922 RepID=A9KH41_COXBN|nr:Dot/Icm T4SS effector CpeI [Coxiella burnetii]ABS78588.1 hypothetical protein CBUD_A0009 [Coxiella burnetii Dugway 5J108-111]OYK79185.1 hypothetical protein CbuD7E6568_11415 [Coxiella burnetii]OYK81224.1 hypothetical protein CbuD7D7780_11670 [Coxiella burnetii]
MQRHYKTTTQIIFLRNFCLSDLWFRRNLYLFLEEVLIHQAPLGQSTLWSCARQYDPSLLGNDAGLWLIPNTSPFIPANVTIKTNMTVYQQPNTEYAVLRLSSREAIQQISFDFANKTIACVPNPELFNKSGVSNQEFLLETDTSIDHCQIVNLNEEREREFPGESFDAYGIYPSMKCTYPFPLKIGLGSRKQKKYFLGNSNEPNKTNDSSIPFVLIKEALTYFFESIVKSIDNTIDALIGRAINYASNLTNDCPSYFTRHHTDYWRTYGNSSPLFFNTSPNNAMNISIPSFNSHHLAK